MTRSIDTMTPSGIPSTGIYGRCSVRSYAPERVDQPTLHALLAAAMHGEPWQFVIVQDADMLKCLPDRAKEFFSAEATRLHPDIGSTASALNMPDGKHELGIPPETTAVAPIIVGKPRGEALPSECNEPQVVAWRFVQP